MSPHPPAATAARYFTPWSGGAPRALVAPAPDDPRSPAHWLDIDFAKSFSESMVRPWAERWFRARVAGADQLPRERPAILVMNHSGMGWPWDAIVLLHKLAARGGYRRDQLPRGFALPWFFQLPGLGPLVLRTGLFPASTRNLERLVAEGELVLYFPEGLGGMAKGWRRRYRLQPFHTSFLRVAARHNAAIIPCACIGAEALNPLAVNVAPVARAVNLPLFPLSPLQVPLFPTWLGTALFALPSRLTYHIGDPLALDLDPDRATEADWHAAADALRLSMQAMINEARAAPPPPGADDAPIPADPGWQYPWSASDRALAAMPCGWPLLYARFWRAYQAAHPLPAPGARPWGTHPLDTADELALLVPWLWPATLARHRRDLGHRAPDIDALLSRA